MINFSHGSSIGDIDGDGDIDIIVTSINWDGWQKSRSKRTENGVIWCYENQGDGHMKVRQCGDQWGVTGELGDVDNDGDLDLYVLNFNQANFLYRNDDGSFIKVTSGSAVTDVSPSISCVWADYDNDLDLDLFMSNGGNQNNVLYRNNGDFTFDKTVFSDGNSSLGGSWGDYDNDGDLDLFVANFLDQNNLLYKNEGAPDYTLTRITTGDLSLIHI